MPRSCQPNFTCSMNDLGDFGELVDVGVSHPTGVDAEDLDPDATAGSSATALVASFDEMLDPSVEDYQNLIVFAFAYPRNIANTF